MTKVLTEKGNLSAIADALRAATGDSSATYTPGEMAAAIGGLEVFGSPWGDYDLLMTSASLSNVLNNSTYSSYKTTMLAARFPAASWIYNQCFAGFSSLSRFYAPNVVSIGDSAFSGCTALSEAAFGDVTSIGAYAFSGCVKLVMPCDFPALSSTTLGPGTFQNCVKMPYAELPNMTVVNQSTFYNCGISYANMPNVAYVGSSAFQNCTLLTSISVPNLVQIYSYAFANCRRLAALRLPKASYFQNNAFSGCSALNALMLEAASYIGNEVINRCGANLYNLYLFGSSVTQVQNFSTTLPLTPFYYSSGANSYIGFPNRYGSVFVPSSLYDAYCAHSAWASYSARIVPLDDEWVSLACNTFEGPVTSAALTASGVRDYAFESWYSLESANLPNAVSIGFGAFAWCSALKSLSAPAATSIGGYAFCGCKKMSAVPVSSFVDGVIANGVFYGCGLTEVSMSGIIDVGAFAFAANPISRAVLPDAESIRGCAFQNCTMLSEVSLPNVTSTGRWVFQSCMALKEASLPRATSLSDTFAWCPGLERCELPEAVSLNGTFSYCSGLLSVSVPKLENIGACTFLSCTALQSAVLPSATLFGNAAFSDCWNLTSLYLLASSVPKFEMFVSAGTVFTNSPIGGYTSVAGTYGSIFVPESMYDAYVSAYGWSSYSARIVSLTDEQIAALG